MTYIAQDRTGEWWWRDSTARRCAPLPLARGMKHGATVAKNFFPESQAQRWVMVLSWQEFLCL